MYDLDTVLRLATTLAETTFTQCDVHFGNVSRSRDLLTCPSIRKVWHSTRRTLCSIVRLQRHFSNDNCLHASRLTHSLKRNIALMESGMSPSGEVVFMSRTVQKEQRDGYIAMKVQDQHLSPRRRHAAGRKKEKEVSTSPSQ